MCAGDRVEAITAADVLYNDFHKRVYERMNTKDGERSCGANYTCPDGEHVCETRSERNINNNNNNNNRQTETQEQHQ